MFRKDNGPLRSSGYEGTLNGYRLIAGFHDCHWTIWIDKPDPELPGLRWKLAMWFASRELTDAAFAARAWIEANPLN